MTEKVSKITSDYSTDARLKRWIFLLMSTSPSVFLFRKLVDEDRERNTIEAAKFLVDANNIYPTRFYFLIGKFLRFSLALGGVKLPKPYVSEIINLLKETRRDPSRRRAACNQILSATSKLSPKQTSANGWKLVSLALSGLGFIRAGTIARNFCLAAALSEVSSGNATNRTTNLAIKGLLESRRFDEARLFIESHTSRNDASTADETYSDYLALLMQRRPEIRFQSPVVESEVEKLFSSLVTGKSIALVAPGVIENEYGQEIDSHDTVFRVKFNGRSAMLDEEFVGRRCDITSHNSDLLTLAKLGKFDSNKSISEAPDLKLIIAKKGDFGMIEGIPVKRMKGWSPTFLTTATSGTLLLFEALRASPKNLKLFGFDFYTNRQIYNKALMSAYKANPIATDGDDPRSFDWSDDIFSIPRIARSHISHDLKSDFLLVKNLYELSGLIDGTPEVLEVLNLSADEYDVRLEEVLGDW
jgi:hypothetical protein